MRDERINVTKTFLPPLDEYTSYLEKIWESGNITNQGPLLKRFEENIRSSLNINNFHFVTNGTVALQIALKALDITEGEIITTPFSYVATASSILWERCTPVFVDIEPDTFCIDAEKIEAAITDKTKAIMPVHVFGIPCDVETIETIAKKHNLKTIYDAAHAFGVRYKGKSIFEYGDISTCSFHATKLFHTIEGGGIFCHETRVSEVVELIKRFGHEGDDHQTLGINAKASELQAAMGLCNLVYLKDLIRQRKDICDMYDSLLKSVRIIQRSNDDIDYNYAYYPVVFETEANLLSAVERLNQKNIYPRRYFYPSLNTLPYIVHNASCPISEDISKKVLCLPLYPGLETGTVKEICETINT